MSLIVRIDVEAKAREVPLLEATDEVGKNPRSQSARVEAGSGTTGQINGPSVSSVPDEAVLSSSRPFIGSTANEAGTNNNRPSINLVTGEVGPKIGSMHDSIGIFQPAWEYEYNEASLEECLAGPIMDAIRALILSDYLG